MPAWMPISVNVPASMSRSIRSRAVSLPAACWRSIFACPPPSRSAARRSRRSSASGRSIEAGVVSVLMGSWSVAAIGA
jgi:hypothetical protein